MGACVGTAAALQLYLREREPVPILDDVRWVPRKVLTVEENLAPNEIDPQIIQPVAVSVPTTLSLTEFLTHQIHSV